MGERGKGKRILGWIYAIIAAQNILPDRLMVWNETVWDTVSSGAKRRLGFSKTWNHSRDAWYN